MAVPKRERIEGMPEDIIRENIGLAMSIMGFLYAMLAAAIGFVNKRLSKIRDHDEDIRRLTAMQSDTAEILACMRTDHATEVHERREEDGRIYARLEHVANRYDDKFDELNKGIHEVGLKVERALQQW